MNGATRAIAVGLLVSVLLTAGCAKNKDGDRSAGTSTSTTSTEVRPTTATSNPPRTSGFTPAREDITALDCKQDGDTWRVTGTVKNPTDAPAEYRIYTLLLDDANAVRGIAQADVDGVAPGATEEWRASIELRVDGLHCGVRVERTSPG